MIQLDQVSGNPIPYWASKGKTKEVFEEAFTDFRKIGIRRVKADIPEGMDATSYLSWIKSYDLAPAVSLFNDPFDDSAPVESLLERARKFAADQASLGLSVTMLSSMSVPARMETPAVGADFDQSRLNRAIELAGKVCEVMISEGIYPLHHSHVGGVFETGEEIIQLLDTLGTGLIGFGPDTGHLRWAGVEPASLFERYRDRIQAMHLKDVFDTYLDGKGADGADVAGGYREISQSGKHWAEPGLGVIDFDALIRSLGTDFAGDIMIEVDFPSAESLYESHRISYEWVVENLVSNE